MYVRPPSHQRNTVRIPENYSGSAFTKQNQYSEMPPPLRTQGQRREEIPYEKPIELDIPPEEINRDPVSPTYADVTDNYTTDTHEEKAVSAPASIFSSLLPKGALSTHFPFGHGIGSEEILILAVMLMVFLSGSESGEVDSEFILLLGLLLFAG